MEPRNALPPIFIGSGTLTHSRDMVRALETIESFTYRYLVDGAEMAAGRATLVRIIIDDVSATTLVNGCLFLNVSSLTYLNFDTDAEGQAHFELFSDGSVLEITPIDEPEVRTDQRQVIRMMEESVFGDTSYASLDDDDEDD